MRLIHQERHAAHLVFDRLWKGNEKFGLRRIAYAWLAEQMGLEVDQTHFSMFTREQCVTALRLARSMDARKLRLWQQRQKGAARLAAVT